MSTVERTSYLSSDGLYRYRLGRTWTGAMKDGSVVWVMLNPSTADAFEDDPTIRRCIGFTRDWGYGEIQVVNLFALRSTDPKALLTAEDPVGPENHEQWREALFGAAFIMAAWGANKAAGPILPEAEARLIEIARDWRLPIRTLGVTKAGAPRHPLYVKATQQRELWVPVKP